jgi:hypothetical protein
LPRRYVCHMGAQAQVDWRGKRFVVHGDATIYCSSPATAHVTYMLRRF